MDQCTPHGMSCAKADLLSIDPAALSQEQFLAWQDGVDQRLDLQAQLGGFQEATEPQDSALIGHGADARIESGKAGEDGGVVERLFHCRVREVEPLLQQVDTQHELDCKCGPAGSFGWAVRLDECYQLVPGNDQVHLVQGLTLARAFGLFLESGSQAHLLHVWIIPCGGASWDFCRVSLE